MADERKITIEVSVDKQLQEAEERLTSLQKQLKESQKAVENLTKTIPMSLRRDEVTRRRAEKVVKEHRASTKTESWIKTYPKGRGDPDNVLFQRGNDERIIKLGELEGEMAEVRRQVKEQEKQVEALRKQREKVLRATLGNRGADIKLAQERRERAEQNRDRAKLAVESAREKLPSEIEETLSYYEKLIEEERSKLQSAKTKEKKENIAQTIGDYQRGIQDLGKKSAEMREYLNALKELKKMKAEYDAANEEYRKIEKEVQEASKRISPAKRPPSSSPSSRAERVEATVENRGNGAAKRYQERRRAERSLRLSRSDEGKKKREVYRKGIEKKYAEIQKAIEGGRAPEKALEELQSYIAEQAESFSEQELSSLMSEDFILPLRGQLDKSWDPVKKRWRHNYQYLDKHGKVSSELEKKFGKVYSITQLESLLTGKFDEDIDAQLEKYEQEYQKNGFVANEADYRRLKRIRASSQYGTVFHQFAEDMAKEGLDISDQALVVHRLRQLQEQEKNNGIVYSKRNTSQFFTEKEEIKEGKVKELIRLLSSYKDYMENQGLGNLIGSEIPVMGSIMTPLGRRTIAATMDQLYLMGHSFNIGDLKTTYGVPGEASFQLSGIAHLLGAMGLPINQQGVIHASKRRGSVERYDFQRYNLEDWLRLVREGVRIAEGDIPENQKSALQQRNYEEMRRKFSGKVRKQKMQSESGSEWTDTLFNGLTIKEMMSYGTAEEKAARLQATYDTLNEGQKKEFDRLLYKKQKGKYEEQWEEVRKLVKTNRSMMLAGELPSSTSFGTGTFQIDGRNISAATLGGSYIGDWFRIIQEAGERAVIEARAKAKKEGRPLSAEDTSSARNAGMRKAADGLLRIIDDKISAIEDGRGTSWADAAEEATAIRFLNSALNRGDYTKNARDVEISNLLGAMVDERSHKGIANWLYEQEYGDIGGGAQTTSREVQAVRKKTREDYNKGEVVLRKELSSLLDADGKFSVQSFISMLTQAAQATEGGTGSILDQEEIKKATYGIFNIFQNFAGVMREAFASMGREAEIGEDGMPEYFDNSVDILDTIQNFFLRVRQMFQSAGLSKEDTDSLVKKLDSTFSLDEKDWKVITQQTSFRFTRMVALADYYDKVFEPGFQEVNKRLKAQGERELTKEEYMRRALTPEQWAQYQDSRALEKMWKDSRASGEDINTFMSRVASLSSTGENHSREWVSFIRQLQVAQAIAPEDFGRGMGQTGIIGNQLFDKKGGYDYSRQFATNERNFGAARLLAGEPLDNLSYREGAADTTSEAALRIAQVDQIIAKKAQEVINAQETLARAEENLEKYKNGIDPLTGEKTSVLPNVVKQLERNVESAHAAYGRAVSDKARLEAAKTNYEAVRAARIEAGGGKRLEESEGFYSEYQKILENRYRLKERVASINRYGDLEHKDLVGRLQRESGEDSFVSVDDAVAHRSNAEVEEINKQLRDLEDQERKLFAGRKEGPLGSGYDEAFREYILAQAAISNDAAGGPQGDFFVHEQLIDEEIVKAVEAERERLARQEENARKKKEQERIAEETKRKKAAMQNALNGTQLLLPEKAGEDGRVKTWKAEAEVLPPPEPAPAPVSPRRRKKPSVSREWDFDETRGDFFYKKKDGSFGGQKVSRKLLSEDQLGRVGKIAPPAGGSGGGTGGTISGGNVTISGGNITVKGSPVKVYGKPVEVRSSTETNVDAKGDTTINVSGPVTMNDAGGGSPTTISLTGNVQILGFSAKVTGGEGERSSKRSKHKEGASAESSSDVRADDSSASTAAPDASASGTEGEKNNSISSIGRLIRELDQLERSIQKFNFRIDNAEGRGTDEDQEIADRLKGARADLEARRDAVMAEYEAEYSGLTTEAQGKADKLFADSKARRDASAESVRLTESTKAEEDQLKRYERLLQERLQIEQKITSNLQKRATSQNRNEIEHLDNALSLEQQRLATLTAEGDQIRKNLKASGRGAAVDAADMAYAERSEMLKAETATNMHGARNIWDILGYDIQRSFNMIFDYGLAYRAISGIRTAFQGVLQDINEFDKAITNLRIVTGDTKEETEDLMRSYNKMADQLGVTTSAIADASNEWLRQGYSIDETNDLIEASIQLSKLGGTTAADATEKLTAVLKGFKMEASEVSDIVDKLVSLDMDFATTASNIGEALSRVSAVARQAGMDLNETAAAVTVVMDATQADAGSVGTAFRTIMTRYMNVKAGQFTDLETGEADKALNDTEKVLKTLGISIRDSKMEFRDFSDVLDELADKWVTLSSVEKSAVAVSLAGTRQQNMFFNLMDNYDKYQEAIETSADSAGTAEEKYEAYSESIEYQVERLTAAWEGFAQKLKANPVIVWLTEQAANLVEYLPNIIRMFVTLFTTINAYKIPTAFKNFFGMFTTPGKYGGKGTASIFTSAGQAQRAAKKQREWNQQHGITSDVDRPFQTLESVGMQGNKIAREGNKKLGFIQSVVAKIANKFGVKTTAGEMASGVGSSGNSAESTAPGSAASVAATASITKNQARANAYAWSLARGTQPGIGSFKSKFGMSFFGPDAPISGISQEEARKIENALKYYRTGKINDSGFNNVSDVHMTKSGKWSFKDASGKRRYSTKKPITAEDYYSSYLDVFAAQDQENINRGRLVYKGKKYRFNRKTGSFEEKVGGGYQTPSEPLGQETQAALTQAQVNQQAIRKQKILGSAATGLASGFSTAMTTEGSAGDKALAGVITGGLSAALSMTPLGPLGGVIGQVVGDIIGPLILNWIHADEIARQERVENSKAYLEALQGLSSTMEEVGDNITKGLENWTAEDYEAQQEYVKEIKSTLYAFDDSSTENVDEAENSKELREAFAEELQKLPEEIQKLITGDSEKVSSSYSDISSALDILASGGEGAEEINAALMAAQYRQQAQALWGSQEEERYQAIQQMSDNFAGYSLLSDLERVKDTEEYAAATEEERQKFEELQSLYENIYGDAVNAYESAQATLDQLDEEVARNEMMSAFYSSGVASMSSLDIGEASLEGTRLKILKDWAKIDETIAGQDGTFTQDAIDMVNDFLRTQENFSSLFESANLTFGEVFDANNAEKRNNIVIALQKAGYSVSNFQDVLDLASKNSEESSNAMAIAAELLGTTVDKVIDDLFNLDASNRQSFAAAFGTSTQFIEENLGALQNLKLEDIINGLDGLNSRYEDIASIFDDIASDLTISQANLDKIMEKYSFLMYGEDEEGNVTFSQENILQNIVDMVVGKGSEASLAYASGIINEANNSTDAFEALRKKYKDNWSLLFDGDLTEEELQMLNSEDATMSSIMNSSLFQKMGDTAYEEWGKIVSQLVGESEYMTILQESVYEYGSRLAQKEIDNLESIKDNLDAINETRQKELDLIKAKDKLENAKNEKQLVYRSGIGWAYESDQTAVQEAKEELDNLETEQQQDDIQYLIDQLTKDQNRLEGADTEEQLRGFKEAFESWSTEVAEDIGKIDTDDVTSAINSMLTWFQGNFAAEDVKDLVQNMTGNEMNDGQKEKLKEQATNVAKAYQELKAAEANVESAPESTVQKQKAIEEYNSKLEAFNTTVSQAKNSLAAEDFSAVLGEAETSLSEKEKTDLASIYTGETHINFMDALDSLKYIVKGSYNKDETNMNNENKIRYAAMTFTNEALPEDQYKWFYEAKDRNWILKYGNDSNPYGGQWERMDIVGPDVDSPGDLISLAKELGEYTIFASMDWGDEFAYYKDGKLYLIKDPRGWDKFSGTQGGQVSYDKDKGHWKNQGYNFAGNVPQNASGTKSFRGGLSYINEAGLEGIITPQGTLTALPSKTGIVPADLTSNLYHLAEVAPNLIKTLDSASIRYPESGSTTNTTDNSTNVQNLYASFQATEDFDFDKFLVDVRGVINNTRHTA